MSRKSGIEMKKLRNIKIRREKKKEINQDERELLKLAN